MKLLVAYVREQIQNDLTATDLRRKRLAVDFRLVAIGLRGHRLRRRQMLLCIWNRANRAARTDLRRERWLVDFRYGARGLRRSQLDWQCGQLVLLSEMAAI